MNCGLKIKQMRIAAGLNQSEFALKAGIPQSSLSKWEIQEDPPLEYIRKSISILAPGMSLSEFFLEDGEIAEKFSIRPGQIKILRTVNSLPESLQLRFQQLEIDALDLILDSMKIS
jgi:transcriptional regulator with XRE-family HTH domain